MLVVFVDVCVFMVVFWQGLIDLVGVKEIVQGSLQMLLDI